MSGCLDLVKQRIYEKSQQYPLCTFLALIWKKNIQWFLSSQLENCWCVMRVCNILILTLTYCTIWFPVYLSIICWEYMKENCSTSLIVLSLMWKKMHWFSVNISIEYLNSLNRLTFVSVTLDLLKQRINEIRAILYDMLYYLYRKCTFVAFRSKNKIYLDAAYVFRYFLFSYF